MSVENIQLLEKRTLSDFVGSLTPSMKKEFFLMVGNFEIRMEKVHAPYNVKLNNKGFMGKFHQHFVEKVITNRKNEDWSSKKLSQFASSFPFKIFHHVEPDELSIFENIDSEFENNIEKFLQNHFDDVGDVPSLIKLFLRNIHAHNVTHAQVKRSSIVASGDLLDEFSALKIDDGIQNIRDLTEEDAKIFLHHYNITREAMLTFSPSQAEKICFDEFSETYFLSLSESNLTELYSFLNPDFYRTQPEQYKELFEKYFFFFLHALRSEEHPVSFIDHLLFECLKSLYIFQKSRENPIILKAHIANLTCVHQRLHDSIDEETDFIVSDKSLEEIKGFFESGVRGIESAQISYIVEDVPLYNKTFACTKHELIDVCFSKVTKDKGMHFIKLIIAASFSKKYFNRLSIYNLYLGVKTWIDNPSCREKVLEFVRKYNKCGRSEPATEILHYRRF